MENNNKELDKYDFNNWNVSATMYSDEKNISNKYYEIFVYIELIKDKLTSENASKVNCSFLDNILIGMFKQLTSTHNYYNVPTSNKIFTVPHENPHPSEMKTGGKYRETRKNKRNKKMRKTTRYRILI